jgi:hypothetical protein
MPSLKTVLKIGTILGEGTKAYTVEKVTYDAIYLRGHPDARRGEGINLNGVLRIIPTIVIEDILRGLESKKINLDDIVRKKGDEQKYDLFSVLGVDHDKYILGYDSTIYKICEFCFNYKPDASLLINAVISQNVLPKPFLLLAGISGTGKTRFVREQAAAHNKGNSNYCLIPVRPDWHEPSDLLGYISRIGLEGPCYVVTKLLVFIVAAWQNAFFSVEENKLICKHAAEMTPYWLCLDEMNLAPVEQYFADYLSVLETRKWENEEYSCDPLLVSDTIKLLNADMPDIGQEKLRKDLKLIGEENDALWAYFLNNGIPIPPNLIVAGTVNMDETTHGFSRKVIDRAFTIDFGVFYPNDYDHYFEPPIRPKTLSFPLLSQVSKEDLSVVSADTDGLKSIDFLTAINTVLKGTPFELAYRALNELLLAVVSFAPKDVLELQAVWDDFLMSKVLPRIDGDTEKLSNSVDDNSSDILSALLDVIDISFKEILIKNQRLDLLRENKDEKENPLMISCRSKQKLEWMKARLTLNGFTTFWP